MYVGSLLLCHGGEDVAEGKGKVNLFSIFTRII